MISLGTALLAFAWLARACARNRAFLLVAVFLLWQFGLKILGVTFLDLFGPIYSDEVYTEVGGIGSSAPLMILFVMIPLVALKIAFSHFHPKPRVPPAEPHLAQGGMTFADAWVMLLSVFVACLYIGLMTNGPIPFFNGLERFEYQGSVFHGLLQSFMFLIGHVIGYVVARNRILTGAWDTRFAVIMLLIFAYLFLTGHRFGSFYVLISFTLVPMAAIVIAPRLGVPVAPAHRHRSLAQRLARSKVVVLAFASCLVAVVLIAMANSLLNVRDGDAGDALLQRLLVQPVHLYWLTWERWQAGEVEGLNAVLNFLRDPFDAARNTGIQYLMFLHLGLSQASQIYEVQQVDYAGGYPEILIEIGGVWIAAAGALLVSAATALLYRISVAAVCRGHFFTSLMAMYVCFGAINLFLGGMISFFQAETYWLKIAALILAMVIERSLEARGKRLIPWVLVPGRKSVSRSPRLAN